MVAECYYAYSSATEEVENPRFLERKLGVKDSMIGQMLVRKSGS